MTKKAELKRKVKQEFEEGLDSADDQKKENELKLDQEKQNDDDNDDYDDYDEVAEHGEGKFSNIVIKKWMPSQNKPTIQSNIPTDQTSDLE